MLTIMYFFWSGFGQATVLPTPDVVFTLPSRSNNFTLPARINNVTLGNR